MKAGEGSGKVASAFVGQMAGKSRPLHNRPCRRGRSEWAREQVRRTALSAPTGGSCTKQRSSPRWNTMGENEPLRRQGRPTRCWWCSGAGTTAERRTRRVTMTGTRQLLLSRLPEVKGHWAGRTISSSSDEDCPAGEPGPSLDGEPNHGMSTNTAQRSSTYQFRRGGGPESEENRGNCLRANNALGSRQERIPQQKNAGTKQDHLRRRSFREGGGLRKRGQAVGRALSRDSVARILNVDEARVTELRRNKTRPFANQSFHDSSAPNERQAPGRRRHLRTRSNTRPFHSTLPNRTN